MEDSIRIQELLGKNLRLSQLQTIFLASELLWDTIIMEE